MISTEAGYCRSHFDHVIILNLLVALLATALNSKLNGLKLGDVTLEPEDMLQSCQKNSHDWDVITVGDMCYDSEFSMKLLCWLKDQASQKGRGRTEVIIGDPGRHGLSNARGFVSLKPLARYSLPEHMSREHYGMSVADIYSLE